MPNQWGTQLSTANPAYVALLGGTVNCPAGVETNVAQVNPLVAAGPGNYYPVWQGVLSLALGATPPTALVIGARVGAGADIGAFTFPVQVLTANAVIMFPVFLVGANSTSLWFPTGAVWNLTVNPTAQAMSCVNSTSTLYSYLVRGPDA